MPKATMSHVIEKPAEEVMAAFMDVESYPQWRPMATAVTKLTEGEMKVGSRFEEQIKGTGPMVMELVSLDGDCSADFAMVSDKYTGGHRVTLAPEGSGTRVDHQVTMGLKGMGWLMLPMLPMMVMMTKRNMPKIVDAFKAHCEGR